MSTTADMSEQDEHLAHMRSALAEAQKCQASPTAFNVGCVLVARQPRSDVPVIVASGYSRELPGNTHAEANALAKLRQYSRDDLLRLFPNETATDIDGLLERVDVYTTMEPCSIRTSGLAPCADALIAARVRRCIIGVGEPDDFVTCEGAEKLKSAGVEVIWVNGLEDECLREARRGRTE